MRIAMSVLLFAALTADLSMTVFQVLVVGEPPPISVLDGLCQGWANRFRLSIKEVP
jgi:hypothetical protein